VRGGDDEWSAAGGVEQTLRDVLGGAGWGIELLEPARWRPEIGGKDVEMAFWYIRAQGASGTSLNYSAGGVFEAQKQLGSIPAVSRAVTSWLHYV
jgi:hypothetical protein